MTNQSHRFIGILLGVMVFWIHSTLGILAQPQCKIVGYDKLNNAVSQVNRIVRDGNGMMWFATTDGLYRYDGYEFKNFKSSSGDGVNMPSNRINSIYSSSEGGIWCQVSKRAFLFDIRTYRYFDVMSHYEQLQGKTYKIRRIRALPCGTTWLFAEDGTVFALNDANPEESLQLIAENDQLDNVTVECDDRQRSWVLTGKHTYLYDKGQLTSFNQAFTRLIPGSHTVWLLSADGSLVHFDEATKRLVPWHHALLDTPITGYSMALDGMIALHTEKGLVLMSSNGKQLQTTAVNWPVQKVMTDSHQHLWVLATDGRLFMADRLCRQLTEISGFRAKKCDIMHDKHDNVWFFTDDGDSYYSEPERPAVLVKYNHKDQWEGIHNTINDGQGGYWFIHKYNAYRLTFETMHFKRLPLHQTDQVRCVVKDQQGRMLVGSRYDESVAVFDTHGQRMGWLTRDGRISASFVSFGASIYSGYCTSDGALWLGTKKDGIFRLRTQGTGYQISQYVKDDTQPHRSVSDNEIYDFVEDGYGRLWIATRKGGLCCIIDLKAETPQFVYAESGLPGWKFGLDIGVCALQLTSKGLLLVGTYNGLFITDTRKRSLSEMTFRPHYREADRKESLSSSFVSDIIETSDHRIFIATGDRGINELLTADLLAEQLECRHYNLSTGFPADVMNCMVEYDGSLWLSAPNQLISLQLASSGQPNINSFLKRESPQFASCRPCQLENEKWVFGADDGAILIDLKELKSGSFIPPIVITGISKENAPISYATGWGDTITLASHERNLTIWFSALDYENTEWVAYAYQLGDEDRPWTYLGQNHSISLAQMRPGTYRLAIRSTSSDGVWCNNERLLTIVVQPTFWETPWAILLMILVTALVAGIVTYTLLYIRRIKRQQHETMEAYLALLSEKAKVPQEKVKTSEECQPSTLSPQTIPELRSPTRSLSNISTPEDEKLMEKIMAFIEEHLSDSDITIDDMASAVAVSRSGLHRKVKHMLGTSPMEFLREARIRRAAKMLSESSKPITQIAYECGFADPKYFSKCFKASTGQTPTEYKTIADAN